MSRVVVVGGGGAGDAAAFALRKRGFDGEVLILSADQDRPYDRPYLSKEFLRGEVDQPKVFLHAEDDYAKERIELRLDTRVTGGTLEERRLELAGGGHVTFDTLVLGLGGTPRRLPDLPAADNVRTLRSLRDSQSLREAIRGATRILVLGAGFIGAEVAASSRLLGKDVLMIETAPVPLHRALDARLARSTPTSTDTMVWTCTPAPPSSAGTSKATAWWARRSATEAGRTPTWR